MRFRYAEGSEKVKMSGVAEASRDLERSGGPSHLNAADGMGADSLEPTLRQSISLIDRFYNGGNRAKPEALDILVVVLDSVVSRMRQQYARHKAEVDRRQAEIKLFNRQIDSLRALQQKITVDISRKQELKQSLQHEIDGGTEVVKDAIAVARDALAKVKTATKVAQARDSALAMRSMRGYDNDGRPLPGREVNLRKKPNGPAARKPGDMLKDLKIK